MLKIFFRIGRVRISVTTEDHAISRDYRKKAKTL